MRRRAHAVARQELDAAVEVVGLGRESRGVVDEIAGQVVAGAELVLVVGAVACARRAGADEDLGGSVMALGATCMAVLFG